MLDDIRTFAGRHLLDADGHITRPEFISAVRKYALEKHGVGEGVKMHAERTARHLWDSRKPRG